MWKKSWSTSRNQKPPPRGELSRGIPEALGRARNRLRRAVRVGLKRIVPPLQGSGIGWGPVAPGLRSANSKGGPSTWASLDRPFGAHLPTVSPVETWLVQTLCRSKSAALNMVNVHLLGTCGYGDQSSEPPVVAGKAAASLSCESLCYPLSYAFSAPPLARQIAAQSRLYDKLPHCQKIVASCADAAYDHGPEVQIEASG